MDPRLPIPNIHGDEWENRSTRWGRKKNISRMQWKPYDINLDEGFTAIKAQGGEGEREGVGGGRGGREEIHTHTYTLTQSYMRVHVLMQYYGRLQ